MHVAASVDADGVFKLYKDGQPQNTNPNGQFPASITRQNYYIGRSNWDENEYFNGLVDDLCIYNRPLADTGTRHSRKMDPPSTPQVLLII